MPPARVLASATWRTPERLGRLVSPPVALLAFATAAVCAAVDAGSSFARPGIAILAGRGLVLVASARFIHPKSD